MGWVLLSRQCAVSHISVWIYCSIIFLSIWSSNFIFCDDIFFGPNSRVVESNFLTKDKTKRQGIKVENAP